MLINPKFTPSWNLFCFVYKNLFLKTILGTQSRNHAIRDKSINIRWRPNANVPHLCAARECG